jgi:uncharacterized protein (TIGR00661 family)
MKRVLVAPMDWGLGHATRCIPIIRELINRNCEVFLAGSGDSLQLLRNEFPQFPFFLLPGYQPVYPSSGSMVWKMAMQLPKFSLVIRKEHRHIERIILLNNIELIISDNRYGCWSDRIPSVFITHQRNILMPQGFLWLAGWVNRLNDSMIKRFTCCWIPDFPDSYSLAGILAVHPAKGRIHPTRFIGVLSRFSPPKEQKVKYDLACILSGPEPQRSILEEIVVKQLQQSGLKYILVRGLLSPQRSLDDKNVVDFLSGDELQTVIEESKYVIARSGYSTVMDLAKLGSKAIFVPTPGQTEQEYLAARLMDRKVAYAMEQHRFDLTIAWKESQHYTGFACVANRTGLLSEAMDQMLAISLPDWNNWKPSMINTRLT